MSSTLCGGHSSCCKRAQFARARLAQHPRASLERAELNLDAASKLAPDNADVKAELAAVRGKLAGLKK